LAALILTPAGLPVTLLNELTRQDVEQAQQVMICLLDDHMTPLTRDIATMVGDVHAQAFAQALLGQLAQRYPDGPWVTPVTCSPEASTTARANYCGQRQ
jgi:hypothetical protein